MHSLSITIGAMIGMAAMLAATIWLAITTAGTAGPFDADPTMIAMGRPSQHAPLPTR